MEKSFVVVDEFYTKLEVKSFELEVATCSLG
jgi:hypothetical protein